MTAPDAPSETGAEYLRYVVWLLGLCSESFNDRYTAAQLLMIASAYRRSAFDILPDQWTDTQLRAAIYRDAAPSWDDAGNPIEVFT